MWVSLGDQSPKPPGIYRVQASPKGNGGRSGMVTFTSDVHVTYCRYKTYVDAEACAQAKHAGSVESPQRRANLSDRGSTGPQGRRLVQVTHTKQRGGTKQRGARIFAWSSDVNSCGCHGASKSVCPRSTRRSRIAASTLSDINEFRTRSVFDRACGHRFRVAPPYARDSRLPCSAFA